MASPSFEVFTHPCTMVANVHGLATKYFIIRSVYHISHNGSDYKCECFSLGMDSAGSSSVFAILGSWSYFE